jgi:hypothetical protein
METDTLRNTISRIILQRQDDGQWKPTGYFSNSGSRTVNYSLNLETLRARAFKNQVLRSYGLLSINILIE